MSLSAPLRIALALAVMISAAAWSQSKAVSETRPPKPAPKPKLTPEQQRGLRLLKASEGEAAGLDPAMRAFVLWQVSNGYAKLLPEKSRSAMHQALAASEGVEESPPEGCEWDVCHLKLYLQRRMVEELVEHDRDSGNYDDVEKMLPQLDEKLRDETTAMLVMGYASKNQFPKALNLLNAIGDDSDYPFEAAEELMVYDSRPEDRLAVFDQAMAHQPRVLGPGGDDVATMVIRFARDLPSAAVLAAIDEILSQAKDEDEGEKMRLGVVAGEKSVYFNSRCQLRLFQLLPTLEDLDKAKAESLLRDNAEVSHALDQYPRGPQSMDPKSYGDSPLPEGEFGNSYVDVLNSKDPSGAAQEQAHDQEIAQVEAKVYKVMGEAENDPAQAYADAQEVPLKTSYSGEWYSPRARALQWVVDRSVKKDPEMARKAMKDLQKLVPDMEIAQQARTLPTITNFYVDVGDKEEARNNVKEMMKLADKLYARDTDSSDPNLLFKGVWPSTALWRRCVQSAAKISPEFAEEIIAQVPDPDIQVFERVNYGATLAGADRFRGAAVEWHKNGKHAGMF